MSRADGGVGTCLLPRALVVSGSGHLTVELEHHAGHVARRMRLATFGKTGLRTRGYNKFITLLHEATVTVLF
jgi:hypothetical protein